MYKAGKKQGIDLGQVINRLLKIADFGHNLGKGFGKRAAHHHPIFLRVPPPEIWQTDLLLDHTVPRNSDLLQC